ncbi:hypothetical protein [Dinoroseobacter sp. S124A]|uniref:hypothetical protein n=1 Tax=Dinoroseobacter sp. S124A TaxID=3415128 RepID=UPI003C7CB9EE
MTAPDLTFSCGWPDKALSSNARGSFRKAQPAKKAAKIEAYFAACDALGTDDEGVKRRDGYRVKVTFYPPDNRKRDKFNMPSLIKSHVDGMAQALQRDDYHFDPEFAFGEVVKHGLVTFEVWVKGVSK